MEKALGLNSKPEIESYGLDRFARACRDRVAKYAGVQTQQSIRLGQWMDWDASYFTMTDTNISYIWGFLKECHERGWLYKGHRSMPWCPRCGTSLSQHELIDSYREITPPLAARAPAAGGPRPRVPGGVDDHALDAAGERGRRRAARRRLRARRDAGRHRLRGGGAARGRADRGPHAGHGQGRPSWSACATRGRSTSCPRRRSVEHRVVAWDEVSMEEGTGIVHIAPGCGAEDFELGQREGLATIVPVDEAGAFYDGFGWLHASHTADAAQQIVEDLGQRGRLVERRRDHPPLPRLLALRHRADLPAGRRVVHPLRRGARADDRGRPRRRVDAAAVRQADGGLASQHGRLVHQPQALLGPAAAVLLLRGRPHDA